MMLVHASNCLMLYNKLIPCFLQSFGRDKEIYIYFFIAVVLYNFVLCFYAVSILLCSGKLRRALNLANQSSECIGEFLLWQSQVLPHSAIVYEIILVGFKFGDFQQIANSPN